MDAQTPGLLATVRSIEACAVRYAAGMVAGGAQTLAIAAALAAQSKELPVSATDLDRQWFKTNPGRQYRHRRETPAEIAGWKVPPRTGFTAWRIIRRSDSTSVSYAFPEGKTLDDYDEELASLFDGLNEDEA